MTRFTGLIGYPVSHSLSPAIHGYWIAQHGLDAEYKLLTTPPPRLRQTMLRMRKKNIAGLNVTVPHKIAVMEYLDGVDDLAKRIGAVNTILCDKEKFLGTNTDAYGFITNLREGLQSQGKDLRSYLENIIILGAGGATRAAIVALRDAGAKQITLLNRSADKAQALSDLFHVATLPWEMRNEALAEATLLVNTTSLGMKGQLPLELDLKKLQGAAAVHDIVYAPLETELLKNARLRRHPVVDGLGMLLYQAQRAFEQWHGILPEVTPALRAHVLGRRAMMVIGVTGGMASGKTTIARMIAGRGIVHVDADKIVHGLMHHDAEVIAAIAAKFPGVVQKQAINRAILAEAVGKNPARLTVLEHILHPRVRAAEEEIIRRAVRHRARAVVLDIPLLFETGAQELCDVVIVAHASHTLRRRRAFVRAGMTEDKWERLISRQLPEHHRNHAADIVIPTGLGKAATQRIVRRWMRKWKLI